MNGFIGCCKLRVVSEFPSWVLLNITTCNLRVLQRNFKVLCCLLQGEDGATYFYQSELPYDAMNEAGHHSQNLWMSRQSMATRQLRRTPKLPLSRLLVISWMRLCKDMRPLVAGQQLRFTREWRNWCTCSDSKVDGSDYRSEEWFCCLSAILALSSCRIDSSSGVNPSEC